MFTYNDFIQQFEEADKQAARLVQRNDNELLEQQPGRKSGARRSAYNI